MSQPFNSNLVSRKNFVEVMDTTLRDGEQTEGVSFSKSEKLAISKKLLTDLMVDRIEVTSARVSDGEKNFCKELFGWAQKNNCLNKIEVLGFVDKQSIDWIFDCGGKVVNLLCKGSEKHCLMQLKKSPEQHFSEIIEIISYARSKNILVNAYLEDFSNGIKENEDYVFSITKMLFENNVGRVMLADTLGVLCPKEVDFFVSKMVEKFPSKHFDFHAHNDYGLAVANSLQAVLSGCKSVHTTVNGLGERTGNAPLEQLVPVIKDFSVFDLSINEKRLNSVAYLVELFSKRRIPKNSPIIGDVAFTQTAGIHADGDKKGKLYVSKLSPDRFGRETRYALGKLSGKSSIEMVLQNFGINLNKEQLSLVLKKVVELGDKKEFVTKEDLLFIIDEIQKTNFEKKFFIKNFEILSRKGRKPIAKIIVYFFGKKFSAKAKGDGGFNAFINALKKVFEKQDLSFPKLKDYEVRIPVGGRTDALVETKIIWKRGNRTIETIGVSTDQVEAAILATEKMVNIIIKLN